MEILDERKVCQIQPYHVPKRIFECSNRFYYPNTHTSYQPSKKLQLNQIIIINLTMCFLVTSPTIVLNVAIEARIYSFLMNFLLIMFPSLCKSVNHHQFELPDVGLKEYAQLPLPVLLISFGTVSCSHPYLKKRNSCKIVKKILSREICTKYCQQQQAFS